MLRGALWPGGRFREPAPARTAEEKLRSRNEANRKLSALVPGKVHLHPLFAHLTLLGKIWRPI